MNTNINFAPGLVTTAQLGNPEDTNGCYLNADIILLGKTANYTTIDNGFIGLYKDEQGEIFILSGVAHLPHMADEYKGVMYCTSARSIAQMREFTRNPSELEFIEEAMRYHRKAIDVLPNSKRTPNPNWGKRAL